MKPRIARAMYASCFSAMVLAIIGILAWIARSPWLFPSLGPTIFLQTVAPSQPGARIWNTLVGHAIGVVAGLAAVFACAAIDQASGMSINGPTLARIAATAIAVGATIALQIVVSAEHPPAAATTMLISLGALPPDGRTIGVIAAGVVLCSGLGEIGRLIYPLRTKR